MEIIDRQTAVAQGLTKYYTGTPCKHGHLSERYTKAASCCACVAASNGRILEEAETNSSARTTALSELKVFWQLIDFGDVKQFYEMLQLEFVIAYPAMKPEDLPRPAARKIGEPFYRVMAPLASVPALKAYGDTLWSDARKAQIAAARAETAKRLAAQIAAANEGDDDSGPSDNWMR